MIRDDEISFRAYSLIIVLFDPFRYEPFPLYVQMVVDTEYRGVLTGQFIAGRFYKKK
jgi:hypothetical protein